MQVRDYKFFVQIFIYNQMGSLKELKVKGSTLAMSGRRLNKQNAKLAAKQACR